MSDIADEELLNGEEFDYEDYDLGCEEEDALLEEEKDYNRSEDVDFKRKKVHLDKKESVSESEEQEDVLNLDIEEDFQVEDKEELIEKNKDRKFVTERSQSSSNVTIATKFPSNPQVVKRPNTNVKTTDTVVTGEQNVKRIQPRTDNKRKRGIGRGNFQLRSTFIRNNIQRDRRPGRRNGTVFINPKYEGFVQIQDNNARLAWDNSNYSQNNNASFIQPWAPGNGIGNNEMASQNPNLLLNNFLGIAFSQPSNLLQLTPTPQPSVLNFEPPPNTYQNQVPFQPVPSIQNSQPYNNQDQVPPFQSYQPSGSQQFNNTPASNDYNYYNNNGNNQQNYGPGTRRSNFDNRNVGFNVTNTDMKPSVPKSYALENNSTFRNNFIKPDDYQNGSFGYNAQNFQQNRNFNNQNFKINSDPNYNFGYENRNINNKSDGNQKKVFSNNYQHRNMNQRENYNNEKPQSGYNHGRDGKMNYNFKNTQNRPFRQISTRNEFANQKVDNSQRENNSNNFTGQKYGRPLVNNNREIILESPEKKMKTGEKSDNMSIKTDEGSNKLTEQNKKSNGNIIDEEEDEEMRLYRLKIEEQKREREKVLKMKEERRRMMLLRQKKEEEEITTMPLEKSNLEQSSSSPATNSQKVLTKFVNQIPDLKIQNSSNLAPNIEEDVPNLTFKIRNNLQRKVPSSPGSFLSDKPIPTAQSTLHPKKDLSTNFMSDRVVLVKNKSDNNEKVGLLSNPNVIKTVNKDTEPTDVGQGFSSFFNNRKVLKKDSTLINTRLVVINNLSASTTQNQLVAMTRGIGEIQKLQMDKQERQATILFKSVASAHAFFKKYQRHMLDLSMIQVKLEPML